MTAAELDEIRSRAADYPDAQLVVLFGSVARGTPAPWSDVDIATLGLSFWRGVALGYALGSACGREPHVVELETSSDWLRFQVAQQGLLVAGSMEMWTRFRAEAALRYFDLAPIIAKCADGVRRRLLEPERG